MPNSVVKNVVARTETKEAKSKLRRAKARAKIDLYSIYVSDRDRPLFIDQAAKAPARESACE
jgi:hypothetical protein